MTLFSNFTIKIEVLVVSVFVRSSKAAGAITLRLGGSYLRAKKNILGAAFRWIFPKRVTFMTGIDKICQN